MTSLAADPNANLPHTAPPPMPGRIQAPGQLVILTIVTLGIYGLIWRWRVSREVDAYDPRFRAHHAMRTAIRLLLTGAACYGGGILIVLIAAAAGSAGLAGFAGLLLLAGGVLLVTGAVYFLVTDWRVWGFVSFMEQARGVRAPLSPGAQMALSLIPIINVVGAFIALHRTQRGLNSIWSGGA